MKKLFLFLVLILTACSQATAVATQEPTMQDIPAATQPSAQDTPAPTPVSDTSISLPPGSVTLVALGDSLTQGDGDDSGRGYPGRLLEMVNTIRPDSTLINLGQSGWSSDALINGDQGIDSQLERAIIALQDAISQGHVAVALVWVGSNDLWYLYEYGGDVNDDGDAQDAEHYRANMDQIISRLRSTGATVMVALLDDQSRRPVALKGEAFTAVTQDELARMSVQVTRYNEIIKASATQSGAWTVDFYNTDIFTKPATLYDDGNHPNQAGYDAIAQKWWEVLRPLLD